MTELRIAGDRKKYLRRMTPDKHRKKGPRL